MLPAFYVCCSEMISKWEEIVPKETSTEIDVWPDLEMMTSEVISRTAFGSSYEEGRIVFELQKEQAEHVMEVARSIYIPGSRYNNLFIIFPRLPFICRYISTIQQKLYSAFLLKDCSCLILNLFV